MLLDFLRSHAETIGLWAGLLTTVSFVPQLVKAWKTGGEGLSWAMLALFGSGVGLWLVYGLLLASVPIVGANGLTEVQVLAIFALKVRHVLSIRRTRSAELAARITSGARETSLP